MKPENMKAAASLLTAVLVPIALALAGHFVSLAIKKAESRVAFVEAAVEALSVKDQDPRVRQWAIDVLETYSGIPIPTHSHSIDNPVLFHRLPDSHADGHS